MGLLDKVKNLFTEEVEVEVEEKELKKKPKKQKIKKEKPMHVVEEPIQKEVIKVEIPSPKETRESRSEINSFVEEETRDDDYKFPFFDDDDFDVIKEEPKKEEKPHISEIYNPPKEKKKVFTPSPIISPVYGFLDKDYQKEDIINKSDYSSRRATVDELRAKAYGSLESDIETTLFGKNRVTFEDTKDLKEVDKELDKIEKEVSPKIEEPRHQKVDDDLTDLLEAEMAKPEKTEKKKKARKISDKELFSLIDSMYEGEIKWYKHRNYFKYLSIYY